MRNVVQQSSLVRRSGQCQGSGGSGFRFVRASTQLVHREVRTREWAVYLPGFGALQCGRPVRECWRSRRPTPVARRTPPCRYRRRSGRQTRAAAGVHARDVPGRHIRGASQRRADRQAGRPAEGARSCAGRGCLAGRARRRVRRVRRRRALRQGAPRAAVRRLVAVCGARHPGHHAAGGEPSR